MAEFTKNKQAYVESRFANFSSRLLLDNFSRSILNDSLEQNKEVPKLRENNPALKLYTNVEGIGKYTSDVKVNRNIRTTEIIGEQLLIMYVSAGVGNWVAGGMTLPRILTAGRVVELAPTIPRIIQGA